MMNFEIVNPLTTKELLVQIRKFSHKKFRFGAGCTDLLIELKKNPQEFLTVINLSQVRDKGFTEIEKSSVGMRLGAGVSAHSILTNTEIKKNLPVLHEAALNLASTQIRQVATVGGNLCTASPSGDLACALTALYAVTEIMNEYGEKNKITIRKFFKGVRKTALKKTDLLYGIYIPANNRSTIRLFSGFIKIGTRKSMECSVVSLAYHIQINKEKKIVSAGIAIGSSAPVIRLAESACDFLIGKEIYKITENEKIEFCNKVLSYASPISDIRASAWYRKEVLFNISKSIFENLKEHEY